MAIEAGLPGSTVSALGVALTVEKVVGAAEGLAVSAEALRGTHGIAHLRFSH